MGHFVGCDSEAIYRVWSPDKHAVYRVSAARVQQGHGLAKDRSGPAADNTSEPTAPSVSLAETRGHSSSATPTRAVDRMSEIPDSDEESSVDDPHDKDDEDLDGDLRNCDQPLPSLEDSTPLEPEHGGLAESDLDFDVYDLTSNTKRMRSELTSRDSMVPFTGREEIVLPKSLRLKNQVKSC